MPQLNFNALASNAPQSVFQGFMQGQQLQNQLAQQQQQRQLAEMQLQSAAREQRMAGEEEAAWKAGAGRPEQVLQELQQRGLGKQAMALQSQLSKQQADKLAQQKTQVELVKNAANQVFANPANAAQILQAFGQRTGIDMRDDLAQIQQFGGNLDAIKQWAAGHAMEADKLLPKFQHFDQGAAVVTGTVDPLTGKFVQGQAYQKAATPGEVLAHQDRQRRLEQEMAMGVLSPESVDFAAQMYYQTGTMPPFGFGRNAAQARDQVIKRAAQIATGAGTESPVSAEEGAAKVVGNKQTVAAQSTALKSFNTGVEGRAIRSFNTAIDHLDTMGQLADALQNGDVKRINQIGQAFASETGSSAPTNFDAAKSIVGGEVAKALTGSNMALKDREEIRDSINRANSPAQLKGVVTTLQKLMGGQLSSLQTQYTSSTGRKDFDTKLSKRSKEVVQTLSGNASAPAAAANVVVTPDGMTHTFPNAQAAANFKKAAGL